ncbi:putative SprT-like family [Paratrimastix pyriformis]|uniref:SprT-like family n=1 Tax=Paratrimastix pyriformis TaxID=342808 RepID=A0ABQ8UR63_9EUKA|nr:putative SprT-like family [Paratrimastix pyriformis]
MSPSGKVAKPLRGSRCSVGAKLTFFPFKFLFKSQVSALRASPQFLAVAAAHSVSLSPSDSEELIPPPDSPPLTSAPLTTPKHDSTARIATPATDTPIHFVAPPTHSRRRVLDEDDDEISLGSRPPTAAQVSPIATALAQTHFTVSPTQNAAFPRTPVMSTLSASLTPSPSPLPLSPESSPPHHETQPVCSPASQPAPTGARAAPVIIDDDDSPVPPPTKKAAPAKPRGRLATSIPCDDDANEDPANEQPDEYDLEDSFIDNRSEIPSGSEDWEETDEQEDEVEDEDEDEAQTGRKPKKSLDPAAPLDSESPQECARTRAKTRTKATKGQGGGPITPGSAPTKSSPPHHRSPRDTPPDKSLTLAAAPSSIGDALRTPQFLPFAGGFGFGELDASPAPLPLSPETDAVEDVVAPPRPPASPSLALARAQGTPLSAGQTPTPEASPAPLRIHEGTPAVASPPACPAHLPALTPLSPPCQAGVSTGPETVTISTPPVGSPLWPLGPPAVTTTPAAAPSPLSTPLPPPDSPAVPANTPSDPAACHTMGTPGLPRAVIVVESPFAPTPAPSRQPAPPSAPSPPPAATAPRPGPPRRHLPGARVVDSPFAIEAAAAAPPPPPRPPSSHLLPSSPRSSPPTAAAARRGPGALAPSACTRINTHSLAPTACNLSASAGIHARTPCARPHTHICARHISHPPAAAVDDDAQVVLLPPTFRAPPAPAVPARPAGFPAPPSVMALLQSPPIAAASLTPAAPSRALPLASAPVPISSAPTDTATSPPALPPASAPSPLLATTLQTPVAGPEQADSTPVVLRTATRRRVLFSPPSESEPSPGLLPLSPEETPPPQGGSHHDMVDITRGDIASLPSTHPTPRPTVVTTPGKARPRPTIVDDDDGDDDEDPDAVPLLSDDADDATPATTRRGKGTNAGAAPPKKLLGIEAPPANLLQGLFARKRAALTATRSPTPSSFSGGWADPREIGLSSRAIRKVSPHFFVLIFAFFHSLSVQTSKIPISAASSHSPLFDGRLPADLPVLWSKRLMTTAGFAYPTASKKGARIELATKIITDYERLVETLAHEMCHVANDVIDKVDLKRCHGPLFKKWGRLCERRTGIEVSTYHNYSIERKFELTCPQCHHIFGRDSRPTGVLLCSICHVPVQLTKQPAATTPGRVNPYTEFVKRTLPEFRRAHPGTPMCQAMRELAAEYRAQKAAGVLSTPAPGPALAPPTAGGLVMSGLAAPRVLDLTATPGQAPGSLMTRLMAPRVLDLTATPERATTRGPGGSNPGGTEDDDSAVDALTRQLGGALSFGEAA